MTGRPPHSATARSSTVPHERRLVRRIRAGPSRTRASPPDLEILRTPLDWAEGRHAQLDDAIQTVTRPTAQPIRAASPTGLLEHPGQNETEAPRPVRGRGGAPVGGARRLGGARALGGRRDGAERGAGTPSQRRPGRPFRGAGELRTQPQRNPPPANARPRRQAQGWGALFKRGRPQSRLKPIAAIRRHSPGSNRSLRPPAAARFRVLLVPVHAAAEPGQRPLRGTLTSLSSWRVAHLLLGLLLSSCSALSWKLVPSCP